MNLKKEYQSILLPLLKASPVIIGLIVISVLVMHRAIQYMVPEYRAEGAIKINNLSYSETAFDLFGDENGVLPKQNENFLTEVEVFRSKDLVRKALEKLDWELSCHRIGQVRTSEILEENPFKIEYELTEEAALDKPVKFDYLAEGRLRLWKYNGADSIGVSFAFGEKIDLPGLAFTIHKNEDFLTEKPNCLTPGDRFSFQVNSTKSLLAQFSGSKLFVKPVEKDVAIIEVYFNHELPEKAQKFVNSLMATYIEEGQKSRLDQSDEMLEYLDGQLAEVGDKLRGAEADLAHYRMANQLVNTAQQTDATLRELTQLDLQRLSLTMKTLELDRLQNYLLSGENLSDFSPNFEALQDPIFHDSYIKAQGLEGQRKDMMEIYTQQNPKVANVESKIREYRSFLHTTVDETLANLRIKGSEVERNIVEVGQRIQGFPEKERRLVVLQRDMSLNEQMYNHLVQKRTKLAIARSSNMFPHKIIEHADRPLSPVSPNEALLYGLAVLLSLLAGMVFAYFRSFYKEKVADKDDLETLEAPLLGTVYQKEATQFDDFINLYGIVAGLDKLPPSPIKGQGKLIVVTSMLPGEGKSFTSSELSKAFAASGKNVLLIDMDVRKPTMHQNFKCENGFGYADILEDRIYALNAVRKSDRDNLFLLTAGHLESKNHALLFSHRSLDFIYDFRWHFDVVVVDTPPLGLFEDCLPLMGQSTANLFLVRAGHTRRRMLGAINRLLRETGVPNLYVVLNGQKVSTKVSGYKNYVKKYYAGHPAMALIPNHTS